MRRYRARHPEYDADYRLTEGYRDSQERYRRDHPERVKANHRAAQRRRRERQNLPAGAAAALAGLERSLSRATEPALVKKLRDACARLRSLYSLPAAPYEETGDLRRRKVMEPQRATGKM